ncbi:MAG: c-type cytochrome [Gammaproteobacteria bacterium]
MKQNLIILLLTLLLVPAITYAESIDELPKINAIAVHNGPVKQLFAATGGGLYSSDDNGLSWTIAGGYRLPATMVTESATGILYAFIFGQGLVRLDDDSNQWQAVNNRFGSQILLQLTAEAENPNKLVALNQFGKLIVSENSGEEWNSIKGPYRAVTKAQERGLALFRENCQACHGKDGVGETYNMQALTDKNYFRAPALNDSEHTWHHIDEALAQTILTGSPRTKRMVAWKNRGLTKQDAQDVVAYIKSLWTQRELDCQGPKHMECMGQ